MYTAAMHSGQRHVLYDNASHTVLAIHRNLAAVVLVHQATAGSAYFPEFTRFVRKAPILPIRSLVSMFQRHFRTDRRYARTRPINTFDFYTSAPRLYPNWTWSPRPKFFLRQRSKVTADSMRDRSALAQAQCDALDAMMHALSLGRADIMTGVLFEDRVAAARTRRARTIIAGGFSEECLLRAPYVIAHAEHEHMSIDEAAHDILLQEELADDFLLKTEIVRVHYFARALTAKHPDELPPLLNEFIQATSRFSLN